MPVIMLKYPVTYGGIMSTADKIALFSMIGTTVSAIVSMITLFFAKTALNTWRHQEVLKSKKDFKMALLELKFVTLWQPDEIDPVQLRVGRNILYSENDLRKTKLPVEQITAFKGLAKEFEKLEDSMQMCARYWFATEKLFKDTDVEKLWGNIMAAYNEYTQGKRNQDYFIWHLDELIKVDLYFVSAS
ncbi:hypothetical protein D9F47_22465 [Escherichia coli]|nr:hypothetical protein [Escherichia coli]